MVNAADLMRQHQAQLSQANAAAEQPPMADPFPALVQDPFPAEPTAPSSSADANGASNGTSPAAALANVAAGNGRANGSSRTKQPDFNSESAFPSLGAAANPAKGQWGSKALLPVLLPGMARLPSFSAPWLSRPSRSLSPTNRSPSSAPSCPRSRTSTAVSRSRLPPLARPVPPPLSSSCRRRRCEKRQA